MKDQDRVPLRVVLRNFLNHIENLESQSCPEKSYEAEFQDLKIFSENVKTLKEYSCLEGEKEVNRKKNRYKDILPFDVSRVVLNEYAGVPGSDYINANFIKGASGSPAYIASQGPLPCTVNDFWRMVVQCEVQVIVMACNEEEAGKAKCEKYWVDDGEEKQFGMISVKLLKSSTVCPDFSIRTMRLKYSNSQSVMEERTVCQLHYVAWPDHGVPTVVQPLLDMVRLVRDTQASETLPVLVHCSAGCGRTGTICAIDYVWGLLRTGKLTSDFSLLGLIREMRKQRIAMVQTKEQYVLVHQAVRELFKEQLCMIDSHPYENVDPNGLLILKEEENMYDFIEYNPSDCLEEKNDSKEKEVKPPPLPLKRSVPKFASKYEKDVENLSAQQRSMNSIHNFQSFVPRKNENLMLSNDYDNNFEKNVQKNADKPIKLDIDKPIPSKGILRVPQLETIGSKSTASIKRSKSLKIVSNFDKNTLYFPQNNSTESKRRSSLESNFEDQNNDFDFNDSSNRRPGLDAMQNEQKNNNVSQLVSKYDIIKNHNHKAFIRSFTSVDIRPKQHYTSPNQLKSSIEDNIANQKHKLLRSNTQVNVLKKSQTCLFRSNNIYVSPTQNNDILRDHLPYNKSLEMPPDCNAKIRPTMIGSRTSALQHQNLKSISGKDSPMKASKSGSYKHFENCKIGKDQIRSKSYNNKLDQSTSLQFNEALGHDSVEKSGQTRSSRDTLIMHGLKELLPKPKGSTSEAGPGTSSHAKYIDGNQLKYYRPQQKLKLSNSSSGHQRIQEPSGSTHAIPKSAYNTSRPYTDNVTRRRLSNPSQDEYSSNNIHIHEEYTVIPDHKSTSFNDHYNVVGSVESEHKPWAERDKPLQKNFMKPSYNSACVVPRTRVHHLRNVGEESKDVKRRIEGDLDISHKTNGHVMTTDNPDEVVNDVSFSKDTQPSDMKYILQNRRNVHQYNSSVHTRQLNAPSFNICSDASSSRIKRRNDKFNGQPRSIDAPFVSQGNTYLSSDVHRNYRENDCFHSAPGVDLDQVAASITKDDENLMKVTLEELQQRKTKLQSTSKDKGPIKGISSPATGDKKKQQQYL